MFRKVLKVNNTYKANLLIHQRSNFNGTLVIIDVFVETTITKEYFGA